MKVNDLLAEKRASILGKWFDLILQDYPADTANFLKEQKSRFANPVGATIFEGIEGLFEQILNGMDAAKVSVFLDNIIRIRAIQNLTASQAVAFIFLLKKVIREDLKIEISENNLSNELSALESKIDGLALSAFDIYMKCREKIYEIKANEIRNMTFRLLQRANLISPSELSSGEEQKTDVKEDNNFNIKKER